MLCSISATLRIAPFARDSTYAPESQPGTICDLNYHMTRVYIIQLGLIFGNGGGTTL